MIRAKIASDSGELVEVEFLIDTGAETTVLTAALIRELRIAGLPAPLGLSGVGGAVPALVIHPALHFMKDDGSLLRVNVECYAFAVENPHDTCLLGRDVLNLFRVMLDYSSDVVCLLTGNHRYVIQES